MDLNPLFTGATSFRPGGAGGELDLFKQAGIELVHGWLVDPATPEAPVLAKYPDYDAAAILIADADHISHGHLVTDGAEPVAPQAGPSTEPSYEDLTEEQRERITEGHTFRAVVLYPLNCLQP